MGINPEGNRNVVDLIVGKQTVPIRLPCIQHLSAQGQNRLKFFVTPHFGTTASAVAFNQKNLVTA